jgi:hypothetical protein
VGKTRGARPPPRKGQKRASQELTPLGKALRFNEADLVSAWERDYSGAVQAAIAGDLKRLVNLLRAHRPLGNDDFDAVADYVEATAKHGHRRRDDAIHRAARLAEELKRLYGGRISTGAINIACQQLKRETGKAVNPERVRDLLNRPKRRRSPP